MIDIDSLHQHFTSLLENEASPIAHDEIQPQINMDIDLDSEITLQEIKTAVYHHSYNKACGPGDLPSELIKASSLHILNIFITKCLKVPNIQKVGVMEI